jgi:hypothetical protein
MESYLTLNIHCRFLGLAFGFGAPTRCSGLGLAGRGEVFFLIPSGFGWIFWANPSGFSAGRLTAGGAFGRGGNGLASGDYWIFNHIVGKNFMFPP